MPDENEEENLRIGIFSWESLNSIRIGGLAAAVTNLTEALAEKGNEVHLFTRIDDNQSEYDQINGVHIHRCAFPLTDDIIELAHEMCESMVERFHHAEDQFGEFDLVHGHDWVTVDAIHKLKNEGYPTVLTYHSSEYGRNGGVFGDWWEFDEISGKEWYGGYVSDRVTAVSSTLKEELAWLYDIPDYKLDVVPNGGEIGKYNRDLDPGRVKEEYGINPLAPVVLFIGRMEYQKGPDILIRAIPHVLGNRDDVNFIFIGKGGMRGTLEEMANYLNIQDSVHFLGYVSDDELKNVLNASDLVCIPSRNEPFGLVLYEAWDAEKAVVGTNVGGLDENIDNFENGIKVYPYPESVAWGINYIIDDAEGVKEIGRKGKEKLKDSTWGVIADRYKKEIYLDLLDESE